MRRFPRNQQPLLWAAIAAATLFAAPLRADVKMSALFTDHMVLQREMPVKVWGTAEAGEEVTVSIQDQKHTATADQDGRWHVKLDSMTAGGPHELKIKGKNEIAIKDVLIGEVWVCSG